MNEVPVVQDPSLAFFIGLFWGGVIMAVVWMVCNLIYQAGVADGRHKDKDL